MIIHLIDNNKIVPLRTKIDRDGFYMLPGYTFMSTSLEFRAPEFEPTYIQEGNKTHFTIHILFWVASVKK